MANIIVPERYSHDVLRGELERIDVTVQLLRLAARKNDEEEMVHLIRELSSEMKVFKEAFEKHDGEMQFVDQLVEEHKHERMVNKNWDEKFKTIQKIAAVVGAIATIISGWLMFG